MFIQIPITAVLVLIIIGLFLSYYLAYRMNFLHRWIEALPYFLITLGIGMISEKYQETSHFEGVHLTIYGIALIVIGCGVILILGIIGKKGNV